MARSYLLTFFSKERTVVDRKQHVHCWFINADRWQWLRILCITKNVTNFKSFDSRYSTNISSLNFRNFHSLNSFEHVQFLDTMFFLGSVTFSNDNWHVFFQFSTVQTTDRDTSNIRREIQRCNQHLCISCWNWFRWEIVQNFIQKRCDGVSWRFPICRHPTIFR